MKPENINVAVRLRPLTQLELSNFEKKIIMVNQKSVSFKLEEIPKSSSMFLNSNKLLSSSKLFEFQNCFNENTENQIIYSKVVEPLIQNGLKGINATILLYGQTGSGKTHTMTGDYIEKTEPVFFPSKSPSKSREFFKYDRENSQIFANEKLSSAKSKELLKKPVAKNGRFEKTVKLNLQKNEDENLTNQETVSLNQGILQIALASIFAEKKNEIKKEKLTIRCSYLEIYNETVFDLLRCPDELTTPLSIFEDSSRSEFHVKGAIEKQLSDLSETIKILNYGEKNRHFAATKLNHHSSRSHTIFRLFIQSQSEELQNVESVLNFVDLAGSEKISRYDKEESVLAKTSRIQESKHINKSLFFLTSIINAKATKTDGFVPYRNSPLTKILKNSLGGNAKTLIILCLTPTFSAFEQSLGTLRFGNLAQMIENNFVVNQRPEVNEDGCLVRELIRKCDERVYQLNVRYNEGKENYENYKRQILEIEAQKEFLKKSNKEKLVEEDFGVDGPLEMRLYDFSLKSCGDVSFYKKVAVNREGLKSETDRKNWFLPKYFEFAPKKLLESEIVVAKQAKINELEIAQQKLLVELTAKNNVIVKCEIENRNLKSAISFLLNQNKSEQLSLPVDILEAVTESSLTLIQNCQAQIINQNLKKEVDVKFQIDLIENKDKKLETNNFVKLFEKSQTCESVIIKTESKRHLNLKPDKMNRLYESKFEQKEQIIELQAQTPKSQHFESSYCDQMSLSELFENVEIITPTIRKSKMISSMFLLGE